MLTKHHQIENPQQTLHTENKKNIKNNTNKIKKEIKNIFYFNWKPKKLFEGDETQAHWNSEIMDKLLNEIDQQNKSAKLEELRKTITEQYKQSIWEELNLTDEQLLSILDAHEQDWKLWELTLWQLRQKVKILTDTITDPKVRRFLLEAGFCGRETTWVKVEDSADTNIKIRLIENLWIKINEYNIEELCKLTEEQIIDVEKNQKRFENLWIKIDGYNIGRLSELTEEEIINLEDNRWRLKNLFWDEINKLIWQMSELTEKEIWIFEKLKSIWIKINQYNIEKLSELTEEQIINVEKNQKRFENLWIEVDGYNINILSKLNNEQIMQIEKGEILKDIQTIKLSECDVNKKYFHFTNKKNIWGILNFWLQPKIWPASKLVNDVPNVSISKGERGMFGIIDSFIIKFSEMQINKIPEEFKIYFTDIDNFSSKKILSKASVYNAICNKLKEDVYIYIDTNPRDQIFQDAKFNSWMSDFCLFDIWVHYSIEPSKLRVITDENGHILSSYDVISHLFEKAQNDCCIRLNFPNLFKMMKFVGKNYSKQQIDNNTDYFDWKSKKNFKVDETQINSNSEIV